MSATSGFTVNLLLLIPGGGSSFLFGPDGCLLGHRSVSHCRNSSVTSHAVSYDRANDWERSF